MKVKDAVEPVVNKSLRFFFMKWLKNFILCGNTTLSPHQIRSS